MTEEQLVSLARSVDRLSRALDEAHNLAASAVEDRDFALAERDELREQVAVLRAERDELSEREPWWVLREADLLIRGHWNFDGNDSVRLLALADDLEHAEATERDALIETLESATREAVEKVAGALMRAGLIDDAGREALVNLDFTEAIGDLADAVLAEAVDQ